MTYKIIAAATLLIMTTAAQAQSLTDRARAIWGPEMRSQPNAVGGYNYNFDNGLIVRSAPNSVGGYNYNFDNGRVIRCQPNAVGGQTCR